MPSRIRVVLTRNNEVVMWGKRAEGYLWNGTKATKEGRAIAKQKLSQIPRLLALMKLQPAGNTLYILREKRGQKKSQSQYWRIKLGFRPAAQAQAAVMPQRLRRHPLERWRFAEGDIEEGDI